MAAGNTGPDTHGEQLQALRLRLLDVLDEGASRSEILMLALQQGTAALAALGGLAHRRDPVSGRLSLAAVSGLPPETSEAWTFLREDEGVAPARAVSRGDFVWDPVSMARSGASGMTAVPLLGTDGPWGALSFLTLGHDEPDHAQREFLRSLAEWVVVRLEALPDKLPDAGPVRQELPVIDPPVAEVLWASPTSDWEYDATADTVAFNAPVREPVGESDLVIRLLRGGDLPVFAAGLRAALAAGAAYDAEFRVPRGDASFGWVKVHGHAVPAQGDAPNGMAGTLWCTVPSQGAHDSAVATLRDMSEGFVAVDRDWRVTFVNRAAERLLGRGGTRSGTSCGIFPHETSPVSKSSAGGRPPRAQRSVCTCSGRPTSTVTPCGSFRHRAVA